MKGSEGLREFLSLLDLVEDCYAAGYSRPHAAPRTASEATRPKGDSPGGGVPDSLAAVAEEVERCTACPLHRGRLHAVPGEGAARPLVLVVGEGPGAEEDRTGRPFVGPAGRYLDQWLEAVKIGPEQRPLARGTNVYIANVVKCRPPANRDPLPAEAEACLGYLERQIALLAPRVILVLGRIAARHLLGVDSGVAAARGQVHHVGSIPAVVTYHPSAVLRDSSLRRPVWEDLKRLRALLEQGMQSP